MALYEKALSFLNLQPIPAPTPEAALIPQIETSKPAAESTGGGSNRMPGGPSRNFIPETTSNGPITFVDYGRIMMLLQAQLTRNGIMQRIHKSIRNYVVGKGFEVTIRSKTVDLATVIPSIQTTVDKFINHPRNNLHEKFPQYCYDHSAYGEVCFPFVRAEHTGQVFLQYIPAPWIKKVNNSPLDATTVESVEVQASFWNNKAEAGKNFGLNFLGKSRLLKVVNFDMEYFLLDEKGNRVMGDDGYPKQNPNFGKMSGDCFHLRTGQLTGQERGCGDTVGVMDFTSMFNQSFFDMMNRYDSQGAVVWVWKIKNPTQEEIDEYSEMPLPQGGGMPLAYDADRFELEPLAPAQRIQDITDLVKVMREIIAAIVGMPTWALGFGGDTNVATAKEQTPVMLSEYNGRRNVWSTFLAEILRFVIQSANDAGMLCDSDGKKVTLTQDQLDEVEVSVNFIPFEQVNYKEIGMAMKEVADAILVFASKGYITDDIAKEVVRMVMKPFGIDIGKETQSVEQSADTKGVGASGAETDLSPMLG